MVGREAGRIQHSKRRSFVLRRRNNPLFFLETTWPKDVSFRKVRGSIGISHNKTGLFGCKEFGSADYLCLCDFDECNNNHQEYLKWYLRHFTTTTSTTKITTPSTSTNKPSSSALSSISVTLLISSVLLIIL